jgi:serine/threonine-protein kinase RIO1
MVEEDMGRVTMLNSPIPDDFDVQLRRIRCLLQHHQILHRDLTWQNLILNQDTGKLYVIDFGDAFVWNGFSSWGGNNNWSSRNVENLFNIWWKHYDEERQLEWLISETRLEVKGDRLWKPPSTIYRYNSIAQNRAGAALLVNQVLSNGGEGK